MLDVQAGIAVHARGGDRGYYPPLRSRMHGGPDPIAVGAWYRDVLGFSDVYVADLDAIAGAAPSAGLYRGLQALGLSTWVDAGLRGAADADRLGGVSAVVAGTETLAGPGALAGLAARLGERLVLGVDIRAGRAVVAPGADWGTTDPVEVGLRSASLGCRRLLLLDLSGVGTGQGPDLERLGRLRGADPGLWIAVGGGVGGRADLDRLREAGASAALVGSMLHRENIS